MEIAKDFEEFFELLNRHKVRYLVVGGYAFAIHAMPRFTRDIDILIDAETSNAKKVLEVLRDFGFGKVGITLRDLLKTGQVIQLGYAPLRIDLLTSVSGVTFKDAWKRKVTSSYGKQKTFFIGKQDLILTKRASGRNRDKADLEFLMEARRRKRN